MEQQNNASFTNLIPPQFGAAYFRGRTVKLQERTLKYFTNQSQFLWNIPWISITFHHHFSHLRSKCSPGGPGPHHQTQLSMLCFAWNLWRLGSFSSTFRSHPEKNCFLLLSWIRPRYSSRRRFQLHEVPRSLLLYQGSPSKHAMKLEFSNISSAHV